MEIGHFIEWSNIPVNDFREMVQPAARYRPLCILFKFAFSANYNDYNDDDLKTNAEH